MDLVKTAADWIEESLNTAARDGESILFLPGWDEASLGALRKRIETVVLQTVMAPRPDEIPYDPYVRALENLSDSGETSTSGWLKAFEKELPVEDLPLATRRNRMFDGLTRQFATSRGPEPVCLLFPGGDHLLGDAGDALTFLLRSMNTHTRTEGPLSRLLAIVSLDPYDAPPRHRSHLEGLLEEGAARLVETGLPYRGPLAAEDEEVPFEALVERAEEAEEVLAFRRALSYWEKAAHTDEADESDCMLHIGRMHWALGEVDEADGCWNRGLRKTREARTRYELWRLLGKSKRETGHEEEAEAYLKRAAEKIGDNRIGARARIALSEICLELGKTSGAARAASEALTQAGQDDPAAAAMAHEALAVVALEEDRDDQALDHLQTACNLAEDAKNKALVGRIQNAIGLFQKTADRIQEAIVSYERAIESRTAAGDLEGLAISLENAARAHQQLEGAAAAAEFQDRARRIRIRLGQVSGGACAIQRADTGGDAIQPDRLIDRVSRELENRGPAAPEELQKEVRDLTVLQEITRSMNQVRDSRRILNVIMDSAISLTGAERGFLLLKKARARDREDVQLSDLRFEVARNLAQEEIQSPERAISTSIALDVIRRGRPVLTEEAGEDERFTGIRSIAELGLRSVLCVPFLVKGRITGALYIDNSEEHRAFTRRDQRLLETLADQAGVAVENAWLFEETRKRRRELVRLNRGLEDRLRTQSTAIQGLKDQLRSAQEEMALRYSYEQIVGRSTRMKEVLRLLDKVIERNVPVLIQGESGTGKELIARAIHYNGPRKAGPFVGENCAAITDQILESELFGHVAGSYTGAVRDQKGLFERAHNGTCFLDEIGDMSIKMQKEILRVLEEGEVRPVGAKDYVKIDVRLISATNRDLAKMVEEGTFRQDLYYRINVFTIRLPPLRERKEDIPDLVDHFLGNLCSEAGIRKVELDKEAMKVLMSHSWPGNVRELRNVIERAFAFSNQKTITPDDLGELEEAGELQRGGDYFYMQYDDAKEQFTVDYLTELLKRNQGHVTNSAKESGMLRQSFHRLLRRYDLDPDKYRV